MTTSVPDPIELPPLSAAERHRVVARRFGQVATIVDATGGWDDATPVPQWRARDIVAHLVTWTGAFLTDAGIAIENGSAVGDGPVDDDPVAVWQRHAEAIQGLLDDHGRSEAIVTHPQMGSQSVADTVDLFITADVYMHTWDLAQSAEVAHGLDPTYATAMLEGLTLMDELLRSSGHYGPKVAVPDDADPVTALMAFVGHDPHWRQRGSTDSA